MASCSSSFEECPVCQNQVSAEKLEDHVNQCFEKQVEVVKKSPAITKKKRQIDHQAGCSKSYDIFNFNRAKKPKIEEHKSKEPNESDDVVVIGDVKPKQNKPATEYKPLAELMRPTEFDHYVGQKQAVGENSIIRNLLNNNTITSAIFWGPPGDTNNISLIYDIHLYFFLRMRQNNSRSHHFQSLQSTKGIISFCEIIGVYFRG